jgi:16S rRNA (guanine1516-N2)-methyltransferase
VLAVERSPVVAALLADGLRRALADPSLAEVAARITLRVGDARDVLSDLDEPPDVVYVDPMFDLERTSSALPRKKIQLLRRLLANEGHDAAELLDQALASGARRVVVKRALRAEPLAPRPSASHPGKLVRYDVHTRPTAPAGADEVAPSDPIGAGPACPSRGST